MKINGRVATPPAPLEFYVNHGEEVFQFRAAVILDDKPFRDIVPDPTPPTVTKPGEKPVPDYSDERYLKAVQDKAQRYSDWLFVASLSATDGLEWTEVKLEDPETWCKAIPELETVFPRATVQYIQTRVLEANAPSQESEKEAKELFFALREEEQKTTSSRKDEPTSTTSGELASDSQSDPQELDQPGTVVTGGFNNS